VSVLAGMVMVALPFARAVAPDEYDPLVNETVPVGVGVPMTAMDTESDWLELIDEDAGVTVTVGVILFCGGGDDNEPPQPVIHRHPAKSSPATARRLLIFINITS